MRNSFEKSLMIVFMCVVQWLWDSVHYAVHTSSSLSWLHHQWEKRDEEWNIKKSLYDDGLWSWWDEDNFTCSGGGCDSLSILWMCKSIRKHTHREREREKKTWSF